jgi:hypothetical protein
MEQRPIEPASRLGEPVEPGPGRGPASRTQWRSAANAAADALQRIVPFFEWLARGARTVALLALAGGAAIWWALFTRLDDPGRVSSLVIWAVVLVAPPSVLLAVHVAIRLLITLPERIRNLPDRARREAGELGRLASEARRVRQRSRLRGAVSVIRLWRRAAASRDLIDLAAPAAFLFAPWTLVAVVTATAAAAVEATAGALVLLWMLLT